MSTVSTTTPFDRLSSMEALQTLATEYQRDHEQMSRELSEVGLLIKQTAAEIDRLNPQRQDAARRIREMETALDHYSRADIRKNYNQAQEAQMRLFMMQSRLEQLEYKQRTLERSLQALSRFLNLVSNVQSDGTPETSASADVGAGQPTVSEEGNVSIQALEEDRRQIAHLLQDGIAQTLAGLILRIQICERLVSSDGERCATELAALRSTLATNLQDVRRMVLEVRPLILDDLGLVPTLRRYVQALNEHVEQPIELVMSGVERRLTTAHEINVFRIAQEALGNAIQHATAKRLTVLVDFGDRILRLVVEDDGSGFEVPAVLQAARARKAPGVAVMLDRAAMLGSRLVIESSHGRGTRITIQIPLDETTLRP